MYLFIYLNQNSIKNFIFLTCLGMVAEMVQKSKFLLSVLYLCYINFCFDYIFHIYVICFVIYLLYIYMYIICFLIFFYIFLFSYYLILNLCDNVFIFIDYMHKIDII